MFPFKFTTNIRLRHQAPKTRTREQVRQARLVHRVSKWQLETGQRRQNLEPDPSGANRPLLAIEAAGGDHQEQSYNQLRGEQGGLPQQQPGSKQQSNIGINSQRPLSTGQQEQSSIGEHIRGPMDLSYQQSRQQSTGFSANTGARIGSQISSSQPQNQFVDNNSGSSLRLPIGGEQGDQSVGQTSYYGNRDVTSKPSFDRNQARYGSSSGLVGYRYSSAGQETVRGSSRQISYDVPQQSQQSYYQSQLGDQQPAPQQYNAPGSGQSALGFDAFQRQSQLGDPQGSYVEKWATMKDGNRVLLKIKTPTNNPDAATNADTSASGVTSFADPVPHDPHSQQQRGGYYNAPRPQYASSGYNPALLQGANSSDTFNILGSQSTLGGGQTNYQYSQQNILSTNAGNSYSLSGQQFRQLVRQPSIEDQRPTTMYTGSQTPGVIFYSPPSYLGASPQGPLITPTWPGSHIQYETNRNNPYNPNNPGPNQFQF